MEFDGRRQQTLGGKRDVNDIMESPPTTSLFYDKRVKKYLGQTAEFDGILKLLPTRHNYLFISLLRPSIKKWRTSLKEVRRDVVKESRMFNRLLFEDTFLFPVLHS